MCEPIKVIWKYKNNNRKTQYNIYIFVGNVDTGVKNILEKIKNMSFIDTLLILNTKEIDILTKKYGIYWYMYFFNRYHIESSIDDIISIKDKSAQISTKFGKDWFSQHIKNYSLTNKQLVYSYNDVVKYDIEKMLTRKEKEDLLNTQDDSIDYKIHHNKQNRQLNKNIDRIASDTSTSDTITLETNTSEQSLSSEVSSNETHTELLGGNYEEFNDDNLSDRNDENDENNGVQINNEDLNDILIDNVVQSDMDELDINIDEEINDLYKEDDAVNDDNVKNTTNSIKKVLKDTNYIDSAKDNMIVFNNKNDDLMYDIELKEIIEKNYIYNNVLYKDDTIKTIKTKICCCMLNNDKFNTKYLLPSRQFLWCEYDYENKINQLMIGQKWIKRNELLDINIVPYDNMRYYEELNGNLKILRDNLKRYGSKIRREDDENNILNDYDDFCKNNEIFLLDIYNEFGKNYYVDLETQKNLEDVYMKIYFNKIKNNELTNIINDLSNVNRQDTLYVNSVFVTLLNDLILDNEVTNLVENTKTTMDSSYKFQESYVIQSVIHLRLRIISGKLDLYRIFNDFALNDKYPFVQYQTRENKSYFKTLDDKIIEHYGKEINKEVLTRWFTSTMTSQYGISFKIKIADDNNVKFVVINLTENGRLEYKTQWKESHMATIKDIMKTYDYIRHLVKKINSEQKKLKFANPEENEFKFAFINSMQKFDLPKSFNIDHNDLSDFSRFFFPFVSLVIEPRKRKSKYEKETEASKYGTYLRYKRISKYDNSTKLEKRILHLLKNYDITVPSLISEISKQFNITEERAQSELLRIKAKYPFLKKARKQLKKMDVVSKYKLPGIGIDIQGKDKDNYKMRITGARSIDQLKKITQFMNVLIYLYIETYLYKLPERKKLKEKLKDLTYIATRRNKVSYIVKSEEIDGGIKQMIKYDKKRLGFKPEEGQNQWSRACQNSGEKRRRPFSIPKIENLYKSGYKLNKSTGFFEKQIIDKGKKVTVRAIKLSELNDDGKITGNDIYYTCNNIENGEYIHIGFLTKSRNPFGLCMPCCFKKDPYDTKNSKKRDFFIKCMNNDKNKVSNDNNVGESLYILQDTNKLQDNRFGMLPKKLDIYLNLMTKNAIKVDQHYLISTPGYFFKLGMTQDKNRLLNAISLVLDTSCSSLLKKIKLSLKSERSDILFTCINNGNTKNQFKSINKYINYLNVKEEIELQDISDFFRIPEVITKNGINIVCFKKIYNYVLDKENKYQKKEDFLILCNNVEDSAHLKTTNSIFILNEDTYYYPIVFIKKNKDENIVIKKQFKYGEDNIIEHIYEYYSINCKFGSINDTLFSGNNQLTAFQTKQIIDDSNLKISHQVVDSKNKTYFVVINEYLCPVKRSGALYNIPILSTYEKFIHPFDKTINFLKNIYKQSSKKIDIDPVGIQYTTKTHEKVYATNVLCRNSLDVPITFQNIKLSSLNEMKFIYEKKQYTDDIDKELLYLTDKNIYNDERVNVVKKYKYKTELYQLFRLEFSLFISKKNDIMTKLLKILNNNDISLHDKKTIIKGIIYNIIDDLLFDMYMDLIKDQTMCINVINANLNNEKFVSITDKEPNIDTYVVENIRETCLDKTKTSCENSFHCKNSNNLCNFSVTLNNAIEFANRIVSELLFNDVKKREIFRQDNYFVQDIVDKTNFSIKKNENILTIDAKTDSQLFDLIQLNTFKNKNENEYKSTLVETNDYLSQYIVNNDSSILRAFANCYYWGIMTSKSQDIRNLGHISSVQTELKNYLKGIIIDFCINSKNFDKVSLVLKNTENYLAGAREDIINFMLKWSISDMNTPCIFELTILSMIFNVTICVYDQNNNTIFLLYKGNDVSKKHSEIDKKNKSINIYIRLSFNSNLNIPYEIESLYIK